MLYDKVNIIKKNLSAYAIRVNNHLIHFWRVFVKHSGCQAHVHHFITHQVNFRLCLTASSLDDLVRRHRWHWQKELSETISSGEAQLKAVFTCLFPVPTSLVCIFFYFFFLQTKPFSCSGKSYMTINSIDRRHVLLMRLTVWNHERPHVR